MVNFIRTLATRPLHLFLHPPSLSLWFIFGIYINIFHRKNCWKFDFWPNTAFLFHNLLAWVRCHSSCSMMQVADQHLFPSKSANPKIQIYKQSHSMFLLRRVHRHVMNSTSVLGNFCMYIIRWWQLCQVVVTFEYFNIPDISTNFLHHGSKFHIKIKLTMTACLLQLMLKATL